MGGAMAIDAGGASSLAAPSAAVDLLLTGASDMVLCAGGQRSMDLPTFEAFAMNGFLAMAEPRTPFDARATGFVPGEGVAILLLKRLADARRDGDRVIGIVRGVGAAANDLNLAEALASASERAHRAGGVSAASVSVVEAGCGIPDVDEQVAEALTATYAGQRAEPLRLGSLVSQVGHLQAAHGLASLIKVTLELEHGQLVPTCGLTTPDATALEHQSTFRTVTETFSLPPVEDPASQLAAVLAHSKTGLAYEVLIEAGARRSAAPRVAAAPPAESQRRIVRIGARDLAQLTARLPSLVADAGQTWSKGAAVACFSVDDRARLAIVAAGPDDLARKLRLALDQSMHTSMRAPLEEQGIFLRERSEAKLRVAYVFPGQGSQYPAMLRDLIAQDAAAARALAEVDSVMASLGYPGFAQLTADDSTALGQDVWTTQVAVLLADTIVLAALTARGIAPDCITAHSFGEFPALVAAGVWNLEQAIRGTRARSDGIAASRSARGAMVSTTAPPDTIERLAAQQRLAVYVTSHNGPEQTVLAGTGEAVAAISTVLQAEGYVTRPLAVPCPFHTPLMSDVQPALLAGLQQLTLSPPRVPLLSSVNNRYMAEPAEILANLVAQLVEPVRYCDQIRRLADEGMTLFIEVGPQQVLTRLNRQILTGREVSFVGCDHPQRGALEQLDRVVALWECCGGTRRETVASFAPHQQPLLFDLPAIELCDATKPRRERMRLAALRAPSLHAATQPMGPAVMSFDAMAARAHRSASISPAESKPLAARPDTAFSPTEPMPIAPVPHGPTPATSNSDLYAFLVDFVVEQTAYPREIVGLDADLEADLGIDSIKKAQLFGELREQFDLQDVAELKLADFPTLRHIGRLLNARGAVRSGTRPTGLAANGAAVTMPSAIDSPRAVSSRQPEPAAIAAVLPAPLQNLGKATAAATADHLQTLLVNFVVEQTGYPSHVVKLDADLEADLGIDSIKKAQLFGELREQFSLTAREGMKLSDYPTLRHILDFLQEQLCDTSVAVPAAALAQGSQTAVAAPAPALSPVSASPRVLVHSASVSDQEVAASTSDDWKQGYKIVSQGGLRVLELAGTPYQMGQQQGHALGSEIKTLLKRVAELPDSLPWRAGFELRSLADAERYFGPAELEELRGIADGVGVHPGNVIAHNLSLAPDYAAGCTQFAVTASANRGEMIHAVNEDAPLALRVPLALARVVQIRRPQGGIPHVMFSIVGQFGGFNGINAHGLAVTSTLLLDRAQPAPGAIGQVHAGIVKSVLEGTEEIDSAVERVRGFARLGAWSMCLSHYPTDRLCYLEYDGDRLRVDNKRKRVLTTNHSILRSQASKVPPHSAYRLAQLRKLLNRKHIGLTERKRRCATGTTASAAGGPTTAP